MMSAAMGGKVLDEVVIMWRVCVGLVICAGCGYAMRQTRTAGSQPVAQTQPSASMPMARPSTTQSATQTEPANLIPIENILIVYLNAFGYETFDFGPVGERIIAERRPEDMMRLRETLEYTDGPRTMTVSEFLPLRHCDYALLIAETILYPSSSYSFGPRAAYEYRDELRRKALRRLFGADTVLPEPVKYIYLDGNGKDISDETRSTRRPGTP